MIFGGEDLQRVRLSPAPDPMWELVLGMHCVQTRRVPAHQLAWHRTATRQGQASAKQRWWATLCELLPPRGNFPDFLTPAPLSADVDSGCEAIAATSVASLHRDLSLTFEGRAAPSWLRRLAMGDRAEIRNLVTAVRRGHDTLIAPHWNQLQRTVTADYTERARTLTTNGVGRLLSGLPGVIGWDGEILTFRYPVDRTLSLSGRGITLIPSYFCTGAPVTLIDPALQPALVYPAETRLAVSEPGMPEGLVPLLGRTRAECLRLLLDPHTTTQIATRLGLSVGSASKQATILRNAGLIDSTRTGSAVVHRITPLGAGLLCA